MNRLILYRLLVAVGFIAGLGLASTVASQRTAASMAGAAETFISPLSSELRQAAALAVDSDDRERFHYVPVEMFPRLGLKIEDMNGRQRQAAHELLETGLSQVGFAAAVDIMELETVLGILEQNNGRMNRNPEWYFFSVFGEPSPRGTWGWRVEGHHLSVHFTVVDGEVVQCFDRCTSVSHPVERQIAPITRLIIFLAVLQMVEDLKGVAQGVRSGVCLFRFAVQIDQKASHWGRGV